MYLASNERTKLTANLFNALAASLIAAGFFAPAIAFLYGISQPTLDGFHVSLIALACVSGGVLLHLIGWWTLRRLSE
jgi:hypothetical protein